MTLNQCVFVVSSIAQLWSLGSALSLHPAASSTSQYFVDHTTPPRIELLQAEDKEPSDGFIPDNATYVSDPATKVVVDITGKDDLWSAQEDIFMRYMPKKDVVMCGCGKCGSTSMLEYTYDQIFPSTWVDTWKGKRPPNVQKVLDNSWEGTFKQVTDQSEQNHIMDTAFSFALIRDPKERLVSAWKSKLACENRYGVDKNDRAHYDAKQHVYGGIVAHVQRLRGQDENITCMTLEMFAEALLDIKKLGRSQYLDNHFLAQDLGCFYRFPPSRWSKITTIRDPDAFVELAERLGSSNHTVPIFHSSPAKVLITPNVVELLDEVTADEYKMLGPYLKEQSPIKADTWC